MQASTVTFGGFHERRSDHAQLAVQLSTSNLWRFGASIRLRSWRFLVPLRGDADDESDLDLYVRYGSDVGMFDMLRLKHEIEDMLHREVDLIAEEVVQPYRVCARADAAGPCRLVRSARNLCPSLAIFSDWTHILEAMDSQE
ncbi:MAG: hypothetical protein R2838_09340 [Caldilineaceae bacterium]